MADVSIHETAVRRLCRPSGYRVYALVLAILIYALWGTPTPDTIGFAEILVGALLLFAVNVGGALKAVDLRHMKDWQRAAGLLLVYGFTVPVLIGAAAGNDPNAMLRDIIPFLFMLLPLFVYGICQRQQQAVMLVTVTAVLLGLIFSLRVLLPLLLYKQHISDPFYLANAPTVLFAAIVLLGLSGLALYRGMPPPYALKSFGFFALALMPLCAMALITQRASIGVVCIALVILMAIGLYRRPLRVALPLVLALLIAAIYWPVIAQVWQGLMHKNELVGFNMRWQEALSVYNEISGSFFTVLFGKGWGASVFSPAAGSVVVNFTHNLMTTYWLKTGLIGVCLIIFYLGYLAVMLLTMMLRRPVMAMALGGPFAVDLFLYASFKSLDFGLLLLLIVLWARAPVRTPDLQEVPPDQYRQGSAHQSRA